MFSDIVRLIDNTWSEYNLDITNELQGAKVRSIAIDDYGNKWVGSNFFNINIFDGTNWSILNWSILNGEQNRWLGVRDMVLSSLGDLWVWSAPSGSMFSVEFNGLAHFKDSNWTYYTWSDSTFRSINSIASDENDHLWLGGDGELVEYDGVTWTIHPAPIELEGGQFGTIAIAPDGTKWVGTCMGGLASFDGTNWVTYSVSNSGLPDNCINGIDVAENGTIWIGTDEGGLAAYDGTTWEVYNASYSGFPDNTVSAIEIEDNKIWIGTGGPYYHGPGTGLAVLDNSEWIFYNTDNSGIVGNVINTIKIDDSGNKWIGTESGLSVFNEEGIIVSIDVSEQSNPQPSTFRLDQNYPNPFNPVTTIRYELPELSYVSLVIYDVRGQLIQTLESGSQSAGYHHVVWNSETSVGRTLSTGLYFAKLEAGDHTQVIKMLFLK